MPLQPLVPSSGPLPFDVQQTAFSHDLLGRFICNSWSEVTAARQGGYPFDAVVVGAGMFGAYCAERLYRLGLPAAMRVLVLEAGALLLPTHAQNLPQQTGGQISAPPNRFNDNGTQNVVWGMPWISKPTHPMNKGFPGLAYCIGGRSLFWGGWSPRLTPEDLAKWPPRIKSYLLGTAADGSDGAYFRTEEELGVRPTAIYIKKTALYEALKGTLDKAKAQVPGVTSVEDAPLAVQGASLKSGLFPFDKFSSCPFLIDAVRNDVLTNSAYQDVSRRIFLLPRTEVVRLNKAGRAVTSLDLRVAGQQQTLNIGPSCVVVLANGTIEATRLALESLGLGSTQFGSPRLGNLMAHVRSNITVRIKRSALTLPPPGVLETTALLVRGRDPNTQRNFHLQITAADTSGPNPEANLWSMVPDLDLQDRMVANQDPNWVSITFRGIGEMEDSRGPINPNRSWIDLSNEADPLTFSRRAFVNLVPTANDMALWDAMDKATLSLALKVAGNDPANINYLNNATGSWSTSVPPPGPDGIPIWRDSLGTTHHEAGPLFMGDPGNSVTDENGKFHQLDNVYVAGPAVFPTLGSANPSLTAISLSRKTASAIVQAESPKADADPAFKPLSLNPADWQMMRRITPPTPPPTAVHYGSADSGWIVLEMNWGYGLYFYTKDQFADFILKVEWRVARRDDNSGVFIRTPGPDKNDNEKALRDADSMGHEIQIDERGYDSNTNTELVPVKMTGAIYDLAAPRIFASRPIGEWNEFIIEARGASISVTLNGQLIIDRFQSNRRKSGFIAVQAHHDTNRSQFRNIRIKKL